MAQAAPAQASDDEDESAEYQPSEASPPEDAAKLARDMARSRLNLKRLALAIHNYADTNQGQLPLAATVGKNGKALLSWRVELLPYLGEQALYNQFKRDEPWDSPHNKKLLGKMPAIYAPPGVKTRLPYATFYQVFVSVGPFESGGMPGGSGGPMMGMGMPGAPATPGGGAPAGRPPGGGAGMQPPGMMPSAGPMQRGGAMRGMPGMGGPPGGMSAPQIEHYATAFVKGEVTRFPASISDGTSNTILIVEAGNPVPWTKPEDLRYADDEPLPELGGLFPNVFHAAFADGAVHTLTKNYNKKHLRCAITASAGDLLDMSKIAASSHPRAGAGGDRATVETWQRKNEELRKELELTRQQIRLLKEEQEVERELAGEDPRVNKLKEEHSRMQAELKKLRDEIDALKKDFRQPRKLRIEDEEETPKKK